MVWVLTGCALLWGIAATAFAGAQSYAGAFACRFFIGLGGQSTTLPSDTFKKLTILQRLASLP